MGVVKETEAHLAAEELSQHPNYGSFPVAKAVDQVEDKIDEKLACHISFAG